MLNLKPSTLKFIHEEAQRRARIRAGKHVLIHEKTPDEILVLPALAQTSDLQEENTVVVEHVVDLPAELAEEADAHVLSHFQTGNLVVPALRNRDISVVHTQNLTLVLGNPIPFQPRITPRSLVAAQRHTRNMRTIIDRSELGERAPTAPDIEHLLALLEPDLLAHDGEFVVLQLLEGFFGRDGGDDAGGVDHAGAEEPAVEVVAAVVVVADLLFVCCMALLVPALLPTR